MLAYQSGIAKFDATETKVFGISTDNTPSQKEFAAKNNVQFPLLSDFAKREVSAAYGVLMPENGMANRSTFVVDKEGKIVYIEQGSSAIDPTGAETACSRAAHSNKSRQADFASDRSRGNPQAHTPTSGVPLGGLPGLSATHP